MTAMLKAGGLLLAASLIFLAGYLTFAQWNSNQIMKTELARTKAMLEELGVDHRDTMDALNRAAQLKEAINERARLREEKLRRALEKDPLARALLSDDLRLCLQWDENGDCALPAAGNSPDGYKNPLPQGNTDGGRHGQNPR